MSVRALVWMSGVFGRVTMPMFWNWLFIVYAWTGWYREIIAEAAGNRQGGLFQVWMSRSIRSSRALRRATSSRSLSTSSIHAAIVAWSGTGDSGSRTNSPICSAMLLPICLTVSPQAAQYRQQRHAEHQVAVDFNVAHPGFAALQDFLHGAVAESDFGIRLLCGRLQKPAAADAGFDAQAGTIDAQGPAGEMRQAALVFRILPDKVVDNGK